MGKRLQFTYDNVSAADNGVLIGEVRPAKKVVMNAMFDSTTEWTLVNGSACTSCGGSGSTYDISSNLSQGKAEIIESGIERNYGSVDLVGQVVRDQMCFDSNFCANDFEFFLVEESKGYVKDSEVDSIVGLARSNQFYIYEKGTVNGPAILEKMYEQGTIQARNFGIYDEPEDQLPYWEFG